MIQLPPNVTYDMLLPAFWLDRMSDPDAELLGSDAAKQFNDRMYEVLALPRVLDLPDTISRDDVQAYLKQSLLPQRQYYDVNGSPIDYADFERLIDESLPSVDSMPVTFGLITQRTHVRSLPTQLPITSEPFRYAFDRAQDTAVDVGWPVAILFDRDETWSFCLTPFCWGWMLRAHIATGTRDEVEAYTQTEQFVVTVSSQASVINTATGAPVAAQMGTVLPLSGDQPKIYEVQVPVPNDHGDALLALGLASKVFDEFHQGYLPLTQRTLFTQAFQLLGETYAWGGSRIGVFGRDCSRFVRDIYATAGVFLPRNSGQQGRVCTTQVAFTPDMSDAARKTALCEQTTPGALLILPGHVMLYLGCVDGEPYVIHDTSAGLYNEIIVSDLSLGSTAESGSLLRRLTHAVIPS